METGIQDEDEFETEDDRRGAIGVGTKETVSLKPAQVTILGYKIEMQKQKDTNKEIGEKVAIFCQHPDKEEPISISSVTYEKDKKLKTSGLWFKLDEDNLIVKHSALAVFIEFLGVKNLNSLIGVKCNTKLDEKGYLCFKAY